MLIVNMINYKTALHLWPDLTTVCENLGLLISSKEHICAFLVANFIVCISFLYGENIFVEN